ncbi:type II toxin-antitoxin system HicB family antitoxin [Gallibacterium anatis]|uniref:Type II toxin-antitoxin system HicB family antitoxin n=3 Tax=Gallibacterium anatis TaxID=750 RepID=A0A930Y873_9PAST|nr:type II toxin-antitoxin system HicB family antitoxin [Gallibacterium anatis]ERF77886.1 antitoxin [Gallibacterium anatis 12656/12]KGQ47060.1 antitoxin [Gallibacterium anatis]KGQ61795.1 antitoxin [Gallibacterium anatis 4895]MBF4102112.1 type II toxin-antitoxin system HicB family antitoxin [Gallibacterium anatis]HJF73562.1 type II toxin-antitoxin system HicB family antitoxin [Gallibacterium anatis]
MLYPAIFEKEDSGLYAVSFRDIPEALTCGDNYEDALAMAKDALVTAMDFYFEDKRSVPLPSEAKDGEVLIELPPSVAAKVMLLNEMIKQNISNVELAKRIHVKPQEVQRITDLSHSTKIDTLNRAFQALGKRLEISVL